MGRPSAPIAAAIGLAALVAVGPDAGRADAQAPILTFKDIFINNPGGVGVSRYDMVLNPTLRSGPRGLVGGRTDDPSNLFDSVVATPRTLSFRDGNIAPMAADGFRVGFSGVGDPPPAAAIVTTVGFLDANNRPIDLVRNTEARFSRFVAGFTNHESFDFSDPSNLVFDLFNDYASDGVTYEFTNLRIYTNLPLSGFTIDGFDDPGSASPVFEAASLTLDSSARSFDLGAFGPDTYQLVLADGMTVAVPGESPVAYDVPFAFGQAVIPEPGSGLLALIGLGGIVPVVARLRRAGRRSDLG